MPVRAMAVVRAFQCALQENAPGDEPRLVTRNWRANEGVDCTTFALTQTHITSDPRNRGNKMQSSSCTSEGVLGSHVRDFDRDRIAREFRAISESLDAFKSTRSSILTRDQRHITL
jgi:hypothetical protein